MLRGRKIAGGSSPDRYLDGYHAARLARSVREYLEDPKRFEPGLG